ncbi:MAG: hypothetical protein Q9220_000003 [cf. Caloplaca sp. 1 TL-2023]
MLDMTRLYLLTATKILALIRQNAITVEDYAQSLLSRIEERDSIVQAWEYLGHPQVLQRNITINSMLDPQSVLKQARALDQVPHAERGPLHGIAIAVKDAINTKDMPTQYGSPLYQDNQPSSDASSVSILRSKTTTSEFTMINSGPNTTNPHDPYRTPGGSSAGSAAAVADFQVPLSLGTQTGGSVIRPASFTGLYAMKPTYNAISTEGQVTCSIHIDTLGFFARSIDDLQLVADIFALKPNGPLLDVPLNEARIAVIRTPAWSRAGPGTVAAMAKASMILENSGAKVEELAFPMGYEDYDALKQMHSVVTDTDFQAAFLKEYRMDKSRLHPEPRSIVEDGSKYTHEEITDALNRYAKMRLLFDNIAANYTAIITPSAVDEAPIGLEDMGSAAFNWFWTGIHQPVINVPAFTGANGMPIGISLVAGRFHDQQLLRVAKSLSQPLMAEGGWQIGDPDSAWGTMKSSQNDGCNDRL